MPTSFIPYRLVHAHRSAPRRTSNDAASIDAPTSREFPHESDLTGPLHSEHAISTARDPSTGIFARVVNNGYTLELSHLSLSMDRAHASTSSTENVRFNFPDKLRTLGEGCIIPYIEDGRAYIVLLTQTDVVYRLKLILDLTSGRTVLSAKVLDDWFEEWEIPEDTLTGCGSIGAWTVIDEDTLILGSGDGGIVRLTRSGKWGRGMSTLLVNHYSRKLIYRCTMVCKSPAPSVQIPLTLAFLSDLIRRIGRLDGSL